MGFHSEDNGVLYLMNNYQQINSVLRHLIFYLYLKQVDNIYVIKQVIIVSYTMPVPYTFIFSDDMTA